MNGTDPGAATPAAPRPAAWLPSLYFAQGLPNVAVTVLSVVLCKNLGLGNAQIALYTAWLQLPWVLKPAWAPLVDLSGTKRRWIVAMQALLGAGLACFAFTLDAGAGMQALFALFWLLAFASATHDIAADGFYMLALSPPQQAAFSGVRSTVFRLSMIAGQGGLVAAAGLLTERLHDVRLAWAAVFGGLAASFLLLAWHHAVRLPRPAADAPHPHPHDAASLRRFVGVFRVFLARRDIVTIVAFLLLFRLPEAQSLKLVVPFLLDPTASGGLGLSTAQVGLVYGTAGVCALTLGGLLGGWLVSRSSLDAWLLPMALAMHVPNGLFLALAWWQPASLATISAGLVVEQFGYGFGFTAYMLYMMRVADGPHRTAHYALCTGFMALGLMLPGMASGWLQQRLGYAGFFAWVCLCSLPSFAMAAVVRRGARA